MLAFTLLLALPAAAAGQSVSSPYRFVESRHHVSAFAGHIWTDEGALNLGPASGTLGGLRWDFRLSGPFNIEAGVSAFPTTRAVMDTVPQDTGFTQVGEAETVLAIVDAGLRFDLTGPRTWYRLAPYVVAGAGLVVHTGDSEPNEQVEPSFRYDPGTSFAGQVGAGIEWFATPRFTVRLDARDYLWQIEAPRGFPERDVTVPTSQWLQNVAVTLGAGFRF